MCGRSTYCGRIPFGSVVRLSEFDSLSEGTIHCATHFDTGHEEELGGANAKNGAWVVVGMYGFFVLSMPIVGGGFDRTARTQALRSGRGR